MKPEAYIQNTQKFFEDALKQVSTFNNNFLQSLHSGTFNQGGNSNPLPLNSLNPINAKQIADSVLSASKAAKLAQETHFYHFKILTEAQFKASETLLHELSEKGQISPGTINKLATDIQQHLVSYGAAVAGLTNESTRKSSEGKSAKSEIA